MSTEVIRHGRKRQAPRRRLLAAVATGPVAVCVGAALVAGGGTYALWSDDGSFVGGTVTAGDLAMTTGTPTWQQVTPGVGAPASGELVTTPDFRSMPGDVLRISVPVTTTLRGDNLNGGIQVQFEDPDALGATVAAGFHIENSSGEQVAPASGDADLGATVEVADIVGDNDGETRDWTVVVTVDVQGDYRWVTDDLEDYPSSWAAGDLEVRLVQLRSGTGFTTAGGAR